MAKLHLIAERRPAADPPIRRPADTLCQPRTSPRRATGHRLRGEFFRSTVHGIVADPSRSIVVYGAGPESKEASVAGDKLLKAGFTDIWEFAGGPQAWLEQGLAAEGKPHAQGRQQPISGSFLLDAEKSVIKWTGANLTNSHRGTLRFTGRCPSATRGSA
jgi:hypothetical protein